MDRVGQWAWEKPDRTEELDNKRQKPVLRLQVRTQRREQVRGKASRPRPSGKEQQREGASIGLRPIQATHTKVTLLKPTSKSKTEGPGLRICLQQPEAIEMTDKEA